MKSRAIRLKPDSTLSEALRDGDPIGREGGMTDAEASALKRAIAAVAADAPGRPLIVNAALAAIPLAILLGVGSALREAVTTSVRDRSALPVSAAASATAAHQLYFQTAGGTRVIWIFTPDEEGK